jgi:hypothetical protein
MKRAMPIFHILLIALLSCTPKNKTQVENEILNCHKLRNGEFEYRGLDRKTMISIKRKDSVQEEKEEKENGVDEKFKIKWTGDCQYTLEPVGQKGNELQQIPHQLITTHVIKVTKGYYACSTAIEGIDSEHIDTIIIIRTTGDFK